MPKIITTQSVTLSTPVVDEKGKPVMQEVVFRKRKMTVQAHDHQRHRANTVLDVDKETAKSLIAAGYARENVAGIDDDEEVNPIKPKADDPLA